MPTDQGAEERGAAAPPSSREHGNAECAVCGEPTGAVCAILDGEWAYYCDACGTGTVGMTVCKEEIVDGLQCALVRGHAGSHRRVKVA